MNAHPNLDMAADLCERAASALRRGDPSAFEALTVAHDLRHGGGIHERLYRYGLGLLHVEPDDIDVAVAAIARGEHPPTSLPARIVSIRDSEGGNLIGSVSAFNDVLTMLGCEAPK